MNTYYIDMSIGGTMTVRVEAPTKEKAQEVAAAYFIDDWENAGQLKMADIHIDRVDEAGDFNRVDERGYDQDSDASIVSDFGGTGWSYAADDPYGRGEDPEGLIADLTPLARRIADLTPSQRLALDIETSYEPPDDPEGLYTELGGSD